MANGDEGNDKVIKNIKSGTLVESGQIFFHQLTISKIYLRRVKLKELQKGFA